MADSGAEARDAGGQAAFRSSDPALNQAWQASPTAELAQELLGVAPDEPGYTCVRIAPPVQSADWAEGSVPIPQGRVTVRWHREGARLVAEASVPVGVHLRPVLQVSRSERIVMDGEAVHEDSIVVRTPSQVELAVLPGSGYRFEIVAQ